MILCATAMVLGSLKTEIVVRNNNEDIAFVIRILEHVNIGGDFHDGIGLLCGSFASGRLLGCDGITEICQY